MSTPGPAHPVSLELSTLEFASPPGGPPLAATIRLRNQSAMVEQYVVAVEGLDPAWYRLTPDDVSLFPDDQAETALELSVPAGAAGGRYPFRIVAAARQSAGVEAGVEATLDVAAVGGVELELSPVRRRGYRTAAFDVVLRNRSNADRAARLEAGDPAEALRFDLLPEDFSVPAGGEASGELRVRARRRLFAAPEQTHAFVVAAFAEPPAEAGAAEAMAEAQGEFVQQALFPFLAAWPIAWRRWAMLLLPLLLGALLAVWALTRTGTPTAFVPPSATPTVLAQPSTVPPQPSPAPVTPVAPAGGQPGSQPGSQPGAQLAGQPPIAPASTAQPASGGSTARGTPPVVLRFGLDLPRTDPALHVPLDWEVLGATEIRLRRDGDGDPPAAPRAYAVVERVEYTLVARNDAGTTSQPATVYFVRPPAIDTFDFVAIPAPGDQTVRLSWQTDRADRVYLDNQPIGDVSGGADVPVEPGREYTLRAENLAGEAVRQVVLVVPPTSTPTTVPTATATPQPTPVPQPTSVPAPTAPRPPPVVPTIPPVPPGGGNPPPTQAPPPVVPPAPGGLLTPRIPLRTGFGINETHYASAQARGLAQYTRWIVEWSDMQREGPGEFNPFYAVTDDMLQREINNGYQLAGLIKNTPRWAQRNPEFGVRSVPVNLDVPFNPAAPLNAAAFSAPFNPWAAFCYQLAGKYRGRVDTWIIWNEAEIPAVGPNAIYNAWAGSAAEYYQLLKVCYKAIKAANPQATVVLTPYSYFRDKELGSGQRLPWFEDFVVAARADPEGAANGYFFDALALNIYRNAHDLWDRYYGACSLQANEQLCLTSTTPDDDYATERADRKGFAQRLAELGVPNKPIWVTETNSMPYDDPQVPGWNTAPDGFRITQDEQASFAIQANALAAVAGYGRVYWHKMQDDRPPVPDELWGLVRHADNPLDNNPARRRPAYAGYQTAMRFMDGAEWVQMGILLRPDNCARPRDANLRPCYKRFAPRYEWAAHDVVFQRGDQRAHVLWNQTGAPINASVPVRGASAVAVDKFGAETPLAPQGDRWVVTLPAASRHFDLFGGDPPGYFYVGGAPVMIVERGVPGDAPVEAPRPA